MNSGNFSICLQALVWNQQYTILLNYYALLVNVGVSQKYISSYSMHDPTHPYRYQMQQVASSADVASLQQNSSCESSLPSNIHPSLCFGLNKHTG
uniref:Uncharacterized protein n=1 Tax=Spironucleus salmonicida TaxID=348837 RepID=V6M0R5_9EUKA|eukprot:EST46714.1 Hypothetical protein SS50377_13266 [Spironucleus salmonicida]